MNTEKNYSTFYNCKKSQMSHFESLIDNHLSWKYESNRRDFHKCGEEQKKIIPIFDN